MNFEWKVLSEECLPPYGVPVLVRILNVDEPKESGPQAMTSALLRGQRYDVQIAVLTGTTNGFGKRHPHGFAAIRLKPGDARKSPQPVELELSNSWTFAQIDRWALIPYADGP